MLALLLVAALLPASALPIAPHGSGDSGGNPRGVGAVKSATAGREDAGSDGAFGFDYLHLVQVHSSADMCASVGLRVGGHPRGGGQSLQHGGFTRVLWRPTSHGSQSWSGVNAGFSTQLPRILLPIFGYFWR